MIVSPMISQLVTTWKIVHHTKELVLKPGLTWSIILNVNYLLSDLLRI